MLGRPWPMQPTLRTEEATTRFYFSTTLRRANLGELGPDGKVRHRQGTPLSQWTRMEFFCWFFVGGITTHTYGFCIPLDFLGIKNLRKNKKAKKIFKGHSKGHRYILWKFYNFFGLSGPFWHKKSVNRSDLTLKAIKAKKAAIRPNLANLDFRIFRG